MIAHSSASLRVVLVAGDTPPRAALCRRIEQTGIVVCGIASDATEAVVAVLRERPDLCLVQALPPLDAIAVTTAVCDGASGVPVVVVGPEPDAEELLGAVAAGASGYITPDIAEPRLLAALSDVAAGLPAFPRRLGTLLIAELRR